jgi:hypothetical protein
MHGLDEDFADLENLGFAKMCECAGQTSFMFISFSLGSHSGESTPLQLKRLRAQDLADLVG